MCIRDSVNTTIKLSSLEFVNFETAYTAFIKNHHYFSFKINLHTRYYEKLCIDSSKLILPPSKQSQSNENTIMPAFFSVFKSFQEWTFWYRLELALQFLFYISNSYEMLSFRSTFHYGEEKRLHWNTSGECGSYRVVMMLAKFLNKLWRASRCFTGVQWFFRLITNYSLIHFIDYSSLIESSSTNSFIQVA